MIKSKFKEISISILIALVLILLMEGVAHFLYTPTRLDRIMKVLEENHHNLWKVKSNLDQEFFGANIKTNKDGFRITDGEEEWENSNIKIAVLGASPSFGWGVENDQTYSSKIFHQSNKKISVKNFSQIGYSSFQGIHILEEAIKSKPTHILITYVINDLDYYRFFYSQNVEDKNVSPSNPLIVFLRNFIKELTLPKFIISKIPKKNASSISLKRETRVSLNDYVKNIKNLIKKSKANGITPILVKFPVNMPIQKNIGTDVKKIQNTKIRERSFLYNNEIEKISSQSNTPLIDFTKVVKENKNYLFLDPNGDTIHPNELGHSLFADEVLSYFKKI